MTKSMMDAKKNPPIINLAGWLISLFSFAIGFWHTHLGLRQFEVLSSNYGSLVFSAIILLVLLVSYYRAVNGIKSGFVFYIICALFFFTFNMNSFYPTYLGRKLLQEETIKINDALQTFASRINREFGKEEVIKKYNSVNDLRDLLEQEISKQSGFGERSKDYLRQINEILGEPHIKPNIRVGSTAEEWNTIAKEYSILVNKRLQSFVVENVGVGKVDIISRINELNSIYVPELANIIEDNSKIDVDSIRSNTQIKTLQQLVTKMDNVCIDANKIASQINNDRPKDVCNTYGEVESQNLGTFAHTIRSVKERIYRIDTWGIIILCLFIDLIVPLAIFFLIRKDTDDEKDDTVINLWHKLTGKKKPSTWEI